MNKKLSKKLFWFLTVLTLFFSFFLMNYYTPYVADDYNYLTHEVFGKDVKITGISSIYNSVVNFYNNWSGRILGHIFATLFSLMPKHIFDIL